MAGTSPVVHFPPSRSRIDDETAGEIVRLEIRGRSQRDISRTLGVPRATVRRVIERTRAARELAMNTDAERLRAVALYRELQRTAWEAADSAMERGRSPAMLLAEVRQAQARIDALLGLELEAPEAMAAFIDFRALVLHAIQDEAPELAPALSQRLLSGLADIGGTVRR